MNVREKRDMRPRRSKRAAFPESNRLWAQLRILSHSLLPILATLWADGTARLRRKRSDLAAKLRPFLEKARVPAPVYLAGSLLIAGIAVFTSMFTLGTTIAYDGTAIGTASDADSAALAISQVESELSNVLGEGASLDMSRVSYSTGLVSRRSVMDEAELESTLNDQLNLVTYAYSLYVDGECLGSSTNKEGLEALLDQVKAPYLNENTQSIEFLEEVEISPELAPGYVPVYNG